MIKPLIKNPAIQRIAAPLMLGLLLLLTWQISFQQLEVPVYIVPKPSDIAMTLLNQSGLLFGSLWVTLKITLLAFLSAVIIGTLVANAVIAGKIKVSDNSLIGACSLVSSDVPENGVVVGVPAVVVSDKSSKGYI